MKSPVPDLLADVLAACADADEGEVSQHVPELANVDPTLHAVAIGTVTGNVHSAGDDEHVFTIQSMSKAFTYALALSDRGLDKVLEVIDVEPSGESFNEISVDPETGRPPNPMVNAGAIAAHSLIKGDGPTRDRRVLEFLSAAAGRELEMDDAIFAAERKVAHRNLALAHLLAAAGHLDDDPEDVVDGYLRQCAIKVTVRDLAAMAATLANGGTQPNTGEEVMEQWVARQVLSVMATCGMYDSAGDWMSTVGLPSKSGISGGIIGVLPGQVGVAVFSPRLDRHGTSARGEAVMQRLSEDMGMHMMNPIRPARSAVRAIETSDEVTRYVLQGDMMFASADAWAARMMDEPPQTSRVEIDLTHVDEITSAGRRMLEETVDLMTKDGHDVEFVGDPIPDAWRDGSGVK